MTATNWSPGPDHGLVWEHGCALLAGSLPLAAVVQLWHAFRQGGTLSEFLQALTRDTGLDVFSLPDFAVALRTRDEWQVAARGDILVQPDGAEPISGRGISTWTERALAGEASLMLGRSGVFDEGGRRPVLCGVVPAAWLASGAEAALAEPSQQNAEPLPLPEPEPASEPELESESEPEPVPASEPEPEPEPVPASEPEAEPEAEPQPDPLATMQEPEDEAPLAPPAPSAPPAPPAPPEPAGTGRFARQYDATALHSVEDAAVRLEPTGEEGGAPAVESGETGDHDGHTVMAWDDDPVSPVSPPPIAVAVGDGTLVLGVDCPEGHPNAPERAVCSVCQLPVTGEPHQVVRPSLGTLTLSSGERIDLVEPLIFGRNPRADRVQGTAVPRLIPLPHGHISSTHLAIRFEQWTILALDLGSTNGTYLRRHGQVAVRLGDRPEPLVEGDVLDLGHGVQLRLEHKR